MTGIDDIYVNIPDYYLDADEASEVFVRKKPSAPMTKEEFKGLVQKGLGVNKKAVAIGEDTTTLAMTAAKRLLKRNGGDVQRLIVASETPNDLSKPLASMLTLLNDVGNEVVAYDTKFACVAGFANLRDAVSIYKGDGRKTLGVAVDIAEYSLDDGTSLSADFTGGAGAVAFSVGEGNLLEFVKDSAYTTNQYDFFKPKKGESSEGAPGEVGFKEHLNFTRFPVVFGGFSELMYLKHVGEAYRSLDSKLSDYKLIAFHTPYPSITKYALKYLQAIDAGEDNDITDLLNEIKPLDGFDNELEFDQYLCEVDQLRKWVKSTLKKKFSSDSDSELYNTRVKPTLVYSSEIGNLYTGSIFLSLVSGLINGEYAEGDDILAMGYGSGASAIAAHLKTTKNTRAIADGWDLKKRIDERKALSAEDYLSYRRGELLIPEISGKWTPTKNMGVPRYVKV